MAKKIQMTLDMKDKASKKMKGFTSQAIAGMKTLAGPLAIGAVIAGFTAMTKPILDYGDKLHKLNLRLGVNVEILDRLKHIADLSGVSFSTLTMGLQTMVRVVSEAAAGTGEAKNAIKELGLSAKQLTSLKPGEQFRKIAERLMAIEDPARRTALAMRLFRSGGVALLQMMPNLNKNLANTTSNFNQKKVEQMALFNDQLTTMKRTFTDKALVPAVTKLAAAFNKLFASTKEDRRLAKLKLDLKNVKQSIKEIENSNAPNKDQMLVALKDLRQRLNVELSMFRAGIKDGYKDFDEINVKLITPELTDKNKKEQERAIRAINLQDAQMAKNTEMVKIASMEEAAKRAKAILEEQERARRAIYLQDAQMAKNTEMVKIASMEEAAKRAKAILEEQANNQKIINDELQTGSEFLSSHFTNGFMDIIDGTKDVSEAFEDMAKSILLDLTQMIIKQELYNAISGEGKKGGTSGSIVGFIGSIAGGTKNMAGGGIIDEPITGIGQRTGTRYNLGEGGEPEVVTPMSKSNGGNVNININTTDPRSFEEYMKRNSGALISALKQQTDRGNSSLRNVINRNR